MAGNRRSRVGDTNPTHFRSFTTFSSDVNLTTQSGCPPYEAERLEVHNDEDSTQDIVLKGPDGVAVTVEIPADSVRVIRMSVSSIESTGDGTETIASVTAFWWYDGSDKLNA